MVRLCFFLSLLLLVSTSCRDRDYDPQAEMDRREMEKARQETETKFPAATSYQLQLVMNHDSGPGMATADIQEIFLEELQSRMGQAGLNPEKGANKGGGDLGVIAIELNAEQAQYREGGSAVEIPTKFEARMTVTSSADSSSWDGDHTLKAERAAPSSVPANGASSVRQAQIRVLVEEMLGGLPKFSR